MTPNPLRELARLRTRRHKRHPAEVTADRLGDQVEQWFDTMTGTSSDAESLRELLATALHDLSIGWKQYSTGSPNGRPGGKKL